MPKYASRDKLPLSQIAIVDQQTIDDIVAAVVPQIPPGGLSIQQIKADIDIADALSKKHASGSDNQDLSGLQPKETGKGLYPDADASKLAGIAAGATVGADWNSNVANKPTISGSNTGDETKATIESKLTGVISTHSHTGGGGMNLLKKTANQTINAGASVFADITGLTFPVVSGVDYAFYFYITFQSATAATGWRAGVNCPTGALDFWAKSDIIANGAAGVATHTERHNTVRDDMTLLTATVTQAVDLAIEIRGRYLCTQNGTFACRFANELATDTNIVVQKGSWGWWF